MSKKRMLIVTSVILSVVTISLGIVKLYQTYALSNYIGAETDTGIDVYINDDSYASIPANGSSNVYYMLTNTNPGTVKYGVAYQTTSGVTVKVYDTSEDPATGTIEENGKKYIKLRLENSNSTNKTIELSTVLGYENGGDLVVPSGVTLVTDTYTPPPTAAEYITKLYTDASKTTVTNNSITYNTAPSVSLMNDRLGSTSTGIDSGNIRYYGASPKNYIYFNCSDYSNQTSSTCETWRIIGVFDGKLKLIRGSQIGRYAWDNKNTSTGAESVNGKNDWTTARLMKLLNPSDYYTTDSNDNNLGQSLYYNSASGKCYSGQNNATVDCDFTSTGIKNAETRNMIAETTYNLGGWTDSKIYPNQIYGYERGTTVYTGRPTTPWTGKIALAYPSDYGYAADLNQCKDKTLYDYDNSTCTSNNWMKAIITNNRNNYGWLLTPYSGDSNYVWYVLSSGYVLNNRYAYYAIGAVPVLSLSSELGIESGNGDGSSSNPYKLSA